MEKYSPEECRKMCKGNLFIPGKLFHNKKYKKLKLKDKVVYAVIEEAWRYTQEHDERGMYVAITREDIGILANMNMDVVARSIKKLVEVGLIEDVRQGLGKPNRIYLLDYTPLPL